MDMYTYWPQPPVTTKQDQENAELPLSTDGSAPPPQTEQDLAQYAIMVDRSAPPVVPGAQNPKVSTYMRACMQYGVMYCHLCVFFVWFCLPQPPVTMKQDPMYAELSNSADGPVPPPEQEPVQYATVSTHIHNVQVRMYMYRLCT